jgi:ribonuclease Z
MYLCWLQLHADINFKLIQKKLLSRSRRSTVCSFHRKIQQTQFTERSHTTRAIPSFAEGHLVAGIKHSFRQKPYEGYLVQGSRGGDDSCRSGNTGPIRKAKEALFSSCAQRTFATSAVNRKFRGTAFGKGTRQGVMGKMQATGVAPEKFYFQFITTTTSDTAGTTLLLHFDNKRYLFGNISEGTQRACIQRGVGLKKVRHMFLTGKVRWRNTGGVIGMILTMADAQAAERESDKVRSTNAAPPVKNLQMSKALAEQSHSLGKEPLTVHGGENLMHTMACARSFVFRKGMPVTINEFEASNEGHLEEPSWSDENIRVWAMPTLPCSSTAIDSHDMKSSDGDASSPETNSRAWKRKRSHDEFRQDVGESIAPSSPGKRLRHQELRQSVVSEMFSSEWRHDALSEISLADVKMPAAIFVRDPETKKIEAYRGPVPGGERQLPNIKVLVKNPWPGALIEDLPPVPDTGSKVAMSYIVQGYPQRGKFDIKKAQALGIPKGRSYSSLAAGESITLENGTVVTPDMVLGPTKPGRGIAIVEVPTKYYISNLINCPQWSSEQLRQGITAICWILGRGVASHTGLRNFIESMPGIEHIISSSEVCPNYLALDSSAASAIRLSRISPNHFPVPVHDNVAALQLESKARRLPICTAANRGLMIQVEPRFLINKDEIAPLLNTAEVVKGVPENVRQYARSAREEVTAEIYATQQSASKLHRITFDPEIITLGTGSALPSKYRNVSATLLRTEKYGNFLFDCGENTLGQLQRVFDPPALRDVMRNLKLIWVSHLHADHHLGAVSIIVQHRRTHMEDMKHGIAKNIDDDPKSHPRVVVASEGKMLRFLEEYGSVENLDNVQPLLCQPYQAAMLDNEEAKSLLEELGIRTLTTTSVDHCWGAQAITITFSNGFKFSYSGDCRPSDPFATFGKDSDVLVHEATFDDDMKGDALAKKHCTTGEALGVATKMKAKNVILTHFSQRYQKLPVMENMKIPSLTNGPLRNATTGSPAFLGELDQGVAATAVKSNTSDQEAVAGSETSFEMGAADSHVAKLDMNICVAFDYMRVRVSDIKHMQKFTPAFAALFEAEQKISVGESATPQEKSEMINRAKGSKQSRQSTEAKKTGSGMNNVEEEASRSCRSSVIQMKQDREDEMSQEKAPSIQIRPILSGTSGIDMAVAPAANGSVTRVLPLPATQPPNPP